MWRLRGLRNWELLFQQYAYADFQRTLRGAVPPKDATPMALKRDPSQNLMSTIHYFAYGSNMSTPRLRYRVPGCRFTFVARLPNHKLCFHKRSNDGSAKCNALGTAKPTDAVIGAVYQIPMNEKPALDDAEGLGSGYHEEIVQVLSPEGEKVTVHAYIADASFIDDSLQPYSWYKDFVLVPKSISYLRNM
jgi:AIG2-like family